MSNGYSYSSHNETESQRAAQRLMLEERRRQVALLVLRRIPYSEIAKALDVSKTTVVHDVKILKQQWHAEAMVAVEDHIAKEIAALNADEGYWRAQMAGVPIDQRLRIYDRVLRIMEHRRKILGLDAPIRMELARAEAVKLAEEYGLDAGELLALAEKIVSENQKPS